MKNQMKYLIVALLGLATALPVAAKQVASKKKWKLSEFQMDGGETLCVASTTVKERKSVYTLEVHKIKNSMAPVEVVMREAGPSQAGYMVYGNLGTEKPLMSQYAASADTQFFWYLPDEMSQVVWKLKNHKEFDLRPLEKAAVNDIDFSLKGAASMIEKMEKRCNQNQPLVMTRLEGYTRLPSGFDQAPKALNPQAVAQMRNMYFEMASKLVEIIYVEAQVEKLVDQYRPYINERNSLRSERQQLTNSVIPGIKADQLRTSERLSQTQARLKALVRLIPQAARVKTQKQKNYDRAYNAIAPHVPEHNRLVRELNNLSGQLDDAESALASVMSELQSNYSELESLNYEAGQLTGEIRNLRNRLPNVRRKMRQARQAFNAYVVATEKQKLLNQTPGYNSKKSQLQSLRQKKKQVDNRLTTKQGELRQARVALQNCKKVPEANCTPQQNKVNRLQQRVSALKTEKSQVQSQINPLKNQVQAIQNRVDSQVRAEKKKLREAKKDAENRFNRVSNRLDRKVARRDNIENIKIPNLRQRNDYLLRRQSQLESDIAYLERSVASALSNLRSFERRTNYKTLEANLDRTKRELSQASSHLANLQNEQSRLQNLEVQDQNRLIQLADDLDKNQKRLSAVIARLGTLNGILADFDAAKAPLDQQLAVLNADINSQKSQYLSYVQ